MISGLLNFPTNGFAIKLFFLFKLSGVTDLKYFVPNMIIFHRLDVFVAMLHDDEENVTPSLCDSVMPSSIELRNRPSSLLIWAFGTNGPVGPLAPNRRDIRTKINKHVRVRLTRVRHCSVLGLEPLGIKELRTDRRALSHSLLFIFSLRTKP